MTLNLQKAVAAAAAAALSLPSPALAQSASSGVFKDGNDLYPLCTSQDQQEIARCEWFLMGAHDMAKFFEDTNGNNSFCSPDGFNAARLRELVTTYWRGNPDARRYSATSVTIHVLREAFRGPCPRS